MVKGITKKKAIVKSRKMKVYFNEEIPDQPFPELTNYEDIQYRPEKLRDINQGEGQKLTEIEAGAMNLTNHTSDELPEGGTNKYDDIIASLKANLGLNSDGFVQKIIKGSLLSGTPETGINITNEYIGYYSGTAWNVFIKNNGYFMFKGDANNYITWEGITLQIKGNVVITGGSGIANLTDAGALSTKDLVAASDCDATIISGGKIITGLLTASNIQTGTLDASVANVINLNADNITVGTLTGRTVQTAGSGKRIVLETSGDYPNEITIYDSGGMKLKIYDNAIQWLATNPIIYSNATDVFSIFFPLPAADQRFLHFTRASVGDANVKIILI